jgi:serine/threonine protein kinase
MQEFCNGGSLRCAVNEGEFRSEKTPNRWRLILSVLRDIAAGLDYMHGKHLCHGDLNPANILLKVRGLLRCTFRELSPSNTWLSGLFQGYEPTNSRRVRRNKTVASGTSPALRNIQQL